MRIGPLIMIVPLVSAVVCPASETNAMSRPPALPPGGALGSRWFGTVQGGFIHQFDASIDGGGEFDANRFAIVGGVAYRPDLLKSVALTVGYELSDYEFSNLGAGRPWEDIHTLKLAAPIRWGLDEHWTVLVVPTIRWNAEDGADWGGAFSGGGFAGFSYRFSERLTIGPGFGVLTQIEDSLSLFPVLIIQWKITDKLTPATGRGLGASQGPGLSLSYELNEQWNLMIGGRYERLRFRLSETGGNPNGVGQDQGVPVYFGVTWSWSKEGSISLVGGVKFGGSLEVDDPSGDEVASSNYDPAPFLGATFGLRF